jgi:hypothetical protein
MAVSVPQGGNAYIGTRYAQPEQELGLIDDRLMGTSAPIQIPVKKPDSPQKDRADASRRDGFDRDFVPPHLLERGEDADDDFFSPSSVKRERLLRRNEILRSTGFIEIKQLTAPTGEIIDVLKEAAMAKEDAQRERSGGSPEARSVHHLRASSLTSAIVGTSC